MAGVETGLKELDELVEHAMACAYSPTGGLPQRQATVVVDGSHCRVCLTRMRLGDKPDIGVMDAWLLSISRTNRNPTDEQCRKIREAVLYDAKEIFESPLFCSRQFLQVVKNGRDPRIPPKKE